MLKGTQIWTFRIIFALVLLVGAASVEAQIFSGRATGINGILTVNGTPTTSIYGDTCPLANTGGSTVATTPASVFNNIFSHRIADIVNVRGRYIEPVFIDREQSEVEPRRLHHHRRDIDR